MVAAGFTRNSIDSEDFTVAKFDRDGILLWLQNLSGNAVNSLDSAHSVVVDHQGNVVAAGSTENIRASGNRASDFTVAKFDRNGALLWQQNVSGTANGSFARSVAVDSMGNVAAVGSTHNSGASADLTVAKFDRDGILLWQRSLNGAANAFDQAFSVAVDEQGNAAVAGGSDSPNNGRTFGAFSVAKFDRDGTVLWQQNLNGTATGQAVAFSVAVDNHGKVVAAGSTPNTGTGVSDFTVVKFDR